MVFIDFEGISIGELDFLNKKLTFVSIEPNQLC